MKIRAIIILVITFLLATVQGISSQEDTTSEITFTCVDAESNEKLDLVLVILLDEEANIMLQTFTDSDGRFSVWVEKGYSYTIVTKSPSYEAQSYYLETSEDNETYYATTLKLVPATPITEVQ